MLIIKLFDLPKKQNTNQQLSIPVENFFLIAINVSSGTDFKHAISN